MRDHVDLRMLYCGRVGHHLGCRGRDLKRDHHSIVAVKPPQLVSSRGHNRYVARLDAVHDIGDNFPKNLLNGVLLEADGVNSAQRET